MINKKLSFIIIITIIIFWFIFLVLIPYNIDSKNPKTVLNGFTMGTTYEVKIESNISKKNIIRIQGSIDSILLSINKSMSTYVKDSEISLINNNLNKNNDVCYSLSTDFFDVLLMADKYYNSTKGAFDPTIMPLMKLWGFRGDRFHTIPSDSSIDSILNHVGFDLLVINKDDKCVFFNSKEVTLDFGAIAKGFAVDKISDFLLSLGLRNHYVEIGGEIICKGREWNISIAYPEFNSIKSINSVKLKDMSIATSGTYNQFFEIDKFEYSHIFDSRLGKPVKNNIISVSVISPKSIDSDALATSLKVIGVQKGLELINNIENTESLFITKENGHLKSYYSKNFLSFITD